MSLPDTQPSDPSSSLPDKHWLFAGLKAYGPNGVPIGMFQRNCDTTSAAGLFGANDRLREELDAHGPAVNCGNIRLHIVLPFTKAEDDQKGRYPFKTCVSGNDVVIHIDQSNMGLLFPPSAIQMLKYLFKYK